ncbi:MAG TPA: dTDP-4-dehydrorhamnose 3,5-epimerase [Cytophagaceae bacterium]|jgi:dTDP-4-dehydrorhamnose 3,5-epimerase|nr:dTDP-4-dehydrorhamnose 3,5-epimerase [Cytophagaceae bacterium]
MEFRQSSIKGLVEITPRLFRDERGLFFESYSEKIFRENGIEVPFVQDNQSFSVKNVLRGLHFQNAPYGQGKLVRVIKGRALDIAVDIRKDSPTFGKYESVILDAEKCNMFYVPEGFAHGFLALEETILVYKCTNYYNKGSESGIIWNDPDIKINWGVTSPIVSEKDQELARLKDLKIIQ